jgi:mRNA-degrading endonuclease RelE of RelBE toxin-antitoxin system
MQSIVNIEQSILENLRQLPPEKQQELLDFAVFLQQKTAPKQPRRSLKGLCADLNIHITEEDIAEARREMWGNFPREFPE